MRVHVVDPSAYTPPYDHALCAALGRRGAQVELITSAFAYADAPTPNGYQVRELFYRHAVGRPGSRIRLASKLAQHLPDMVRYRGAARTADVVHFQWLPVQPLDAHLLPRRPLVLTAHDLLPREPRPGQVRAQRRLYDACDALVAHSEYGRRQLVESLGIEPAKVHVIHHGAFDHLLEQAPEVPLPHELALVRGPVVLFFGLLRPYKGIEVLLDAWRGLAGAWTHHAHSWPHHARAWPHHARAEPDHARAEPDHLRAEPNHARAELWIVGRPRIPLEPLRATAPPGVRFVPRFIPDAELPAYFRRADVVVLPYLRTERLDFSGVLATAMAFGRAVVASDVGGFSEVAAADGLRLVPPGDSSSLRQALAELIEDSSVRERLAAGARAAAAGPYSWDQAAAQTIALYRRLLAT
jgi:glycosyltransferase involved in cell wall biosynthesis